MKLVLTVGVVLSVCGGVACAETNALPYPWELPTDAEAMCLFIAPPPSDNLTPAIARTMLGDREPTRAPKWLGGAYGACALLADGTYCVALWTDPVVSGQQARVMLNWRNIFCSRVIEHGVPIPTPAVANGGTRIGLGREPVFIQCNQNPDQWLTSSLFWAALPYELGARVMLDQGSILVGITNYLDRPISGTVRIVHGEGVRLLVTTIGFAAPARGVAFQHLPVREATMDEPFIESMVVLGDMQPRHVRMLLTQCRSGALFRNPELGKIVGPLPPQARVDFSAMPGGKVSMMVDSYPLVRHVRFEFPGTEVVWTGSGVESTGVAVMAGVRVAALKRMFSHNGRGDCQAFIGYDMKAKGPAASEDPRLACDLAWPAVSNGLVVAKVKGSYHCGLLDAGHIADTIATLSGQDVDEWSVVLAHDWLTINLDSAWVQIGRAGTYPGADMRLTIRSRTPWTSPAPHGRSGNIQFFMHLPVGK